MALSSRLRSSTARLSGWPGTTTGSPSSTPRSMPRACACGSTAVMPSRTRACRSTGRAAWPWPAWASWRASTSICSTSAMARSMPWFSRCTAASRAASSPARPRACACSFNAVSGERSSCAASATKLFCASKACCTRSNSRFNSCTSGRTSSGRPWVSSGERSSAARLATCRRMRCTGASERRMTQATASISSGAISASGQVARQAMARARASRASMSWAICTVWKRFCTEYTR